MCRPDSTSAITWKDYTRDDRMGVSDSGSANSLRLMKNSVQRMRLVIHQFDQVVGTDVRLANTDVFDEQRKTLRVKDINWAYAYVLLVPSIQFGKRQAQKKFERTQH